MARAAFASSELAFSLTHKNYPGLYRRIVPSLYAYTL
jgi:hypothetical protein